jgi:hypothetical protein
MRSNPTRQPRRPLRTSSRVLLGLYGVQLVIVGTSYFWPAIDSEDAERRYVVTRFNGLMSFMPVVGVLPEITGEPVSLIVTDKRTGTRARKHYDLIGDVQEDYPVLRGEKFTRRWFD